MADVTLQAKAPLAFDLYTDYETTGRFVLVDDYDVSGGGIITEMVADREETLRIEARQRDFAWVTGDVTLADRAKHYGHRAALVLLIGPDTTGKTFLAKKSGIHARGRRPARLYAGPGKPAPGARRRPAGRRCPGNDPSLRGSGTTAHRYRRPADFHYQLIQRLPADQTVEAIRTLVHPAPVLTVYMSQETTPSPVEADLAFTGPEDFTSTAHAVLTALKEKGIIAETIGNQPVFQFSI